MTCLVCQSPSDGRRFCKPDCYMVYADGRERRPGSGIAAFIVRDSVTKELVPA